MREWTTLKKLIWLYATKLKGGASAIIETITGTLPLVLQNAISHAIVSLTRYGKVEQRNLPQGYTQLDYIEGDGTAYIDTGVLLSNTDVFEITFQSLNALASPVMGAISGGTSYTSTNNLSVTYTINTGLSAYSVYCDGAAGNADYSWNGGNRADGLKHTIKYNGLNIAPMLDGVAMTQVTSHTLVESTPTVTTWLFGRNSTSTGTLAQSGVRIFDFNIQSKGHFIPARRNSDNVLGMYDLVSGQFLTNAGTGSFTAGPDATPSPSTPMDIVCNNGELRYGKPLTLDPTRISAYINENGYWLYSSDSYSIAVPVEVGTKVAIRFTNTDSSVVGSIFRCGFRNNATPDEPTSATMLSQVYRGTPQEREYVELTADRPYLIIQIASSRAAHVLSSGYLVVSQQEIYTDGTPEVLTVSGKNLFNVSTETQGYFIAANGTITYNIDSAYSALIPCKPNTDYTFSGIGGSQGGNKRLHAYDANGNWISQISYAQAVSLDEAFSATGTTPATASYLRISYAIPDTDKQLELGSTATAYEPYVAPQTASVPMLLGVGDYKDEAELIHGIKTGKVGIKVYTGEETFNYTTIVNQCYTDMAPFGAISSLTNRRLVCTHFGSADRLPEQGSRQGVCIIGKNGANCYVAFGATVDYPSIDAFKAFLAAQYAAGTPVIVLYPLATETTEQTTAQHLATHEGTNIVDSVANVGPVEAKVEYMASQSNAAPLLGMMGQSEPQDEPEAAEEVSEPEESE